MKTLRDLDCSGKRVMVRVDYNVPIDGGVVLNTERIRSSIDTIEFLISKGAKEIILISHLGNPKAPSEKLSLFPIVSVLESFLGKRVVFLKNFVSSGSLVTLLENLRFNPGEEGNDIKFAEMLASMADFYVNDAFSCSHRNNASIVLLPLLLPSFAGIALEREMKALDLDDIFSSRPVVAIIGGAKVSTKLPVINRLLDKVDKVIICGVIANTLLKCSGFDIGRSLYEDLDQNIDFGNGNVFLPFDVITSTSVHDKNYRVCDVRWLPKNDMILDVGPATVIRIKNVLTEAKTVLWNGPLGAFEFPPFDDSSVKLGRHISNLTNTGKLKSILGGGDTTYMISKMGNNCKFSYVSNAGGAFLKWLECDTLVGLRALSGEILMC